MHTQIPSYLHFLIKLHAPYLVKNNQIVGINKVIIYNKMGLPLCLHFDDNLMLLPSHQVVRFKNMYIRILMWVGHCVYLQRNQPTRSFSWSHAPNYRFSMLHASFLLRYTIFNMMIFGLLCQNGSHISFNLLEIRSWALLYLFFFYHASLIGYSYHVCV